MFRHYRVIFRQLVFITSPSYISISIAAVGNTVQANKIFKTLKLSNVKYNDYYYNSYEVCMVAVYVICNKYGFH